MQAYSARSAVMLALGCISFLYAACSTPTEAAEASAGDAEVLSDAEIATDAEAFEDAGGDARVDVPLVHSALWEVVEGEADPFHPDDRPEGPCSPSAYGEEVLGGPLVFYVQTDGCAYLTVRQDSRGPVHAGDRLRLELFHFLLTAPVGGTTHLAVRIGDTLLWERHIAVPADSARIEEVWVAPDDYPSDTPVYFHVHNHGTNEYALVGLTRLGTDDAP